MNSTVGGRHSTAVTTHFSAFAFAVFLFVSEFGYPLWFVKATAAVEALAAMALISHSAAGAFLVAGLAGGAAYSHAVRQRAPAAAAVPLLFLAMLVVMLLLQTPPMDTIEWAAAAAAVPGGAVVCAAIASLQSARPPASLKRNSSKAA